MAYKVAFTSTDGKVVNEHFGRAKEFHIVEIDDANKSYKFIETRINEPSCNEFQHSDDGLKNSIDLINDCKVIFVARIGQGALTEIEANGIQAIEAPYFIEDILERLINGKVKLINDRK